VKFSTRSTGQGTQKKSWKNELHLFLETQCHVPYSTSLPIGWLLKSRLVPVSASRVTHHKLTPSTQWAFTFYPRCVSLLSSENSDKNMTEANKTVTGKSAMAIGKAIRSQINHRRSSSLQLSNRSARRLQAREAISSTATTT
jgi:hypothetical protein